MDFSLPFVIPVFQLILQSLAFKNDLLRLRARFSCDPFVPADDREELQSNFNLLGKSRLIFKFCRSGPVENVKN